MRTLLALLLLWGPASAGPSIAVQSQDATVYDSHADGVTIPQVVKKVDAEYTGEAMRQMIEGDVLLGAVIQSDGKVGDVTVKESLDAVYGLDQQAVKAMKLWEFKPGTKDGKPVAVRVDVRMRFTLR